MEVQLSRAKRYPIPMAVQYRECGEESWHHGRVENISRTGVLFTVEQILGVSHPIEMVFQLPVEIGGAKAGQVICAGQVVRTILPAATDQSPSIAASIQSYELSQTDLESRDSAARE